MYIIRLCQYFTLSKNLISNHPARKWKQNIKKYWKGNLSFFRRDAFLYLSPSLSVAALC